MESPVSVMNSSLEAPSECIPLEPLRSNEKSVLGLFFHARGAWGKHGKHECVENVWSERMDHAWATWVCSIVLSMYGRGAWTMPENIIPPFVISLKASWIFIHYLPKVFTSLQMSCFVDLHDFFVNYSKTP